MYEKLLLILLQRSKEEIEICDEEIEWFSTYALSLSAKERESGNATKGCYWLDTCVKLIEITDLQCEHHKELLEKIQKERGECENAALAAVSDG